MTRKVGSRSIGFLPWRRVCSLCYIIAWISV